MCSNFREDRRTRYGWTTITCPLDNEDKRAVISEYTEIRIIDYIACQCTQKTIQCFNDCPQKDCEYRKFY